MLSVIIPAYNRAHLLPRALFSVFGQRMPAGEVIVVDDGSEDGTAALLEEIRAQAPVPLHVIRQENRGAAAARNVGLRLAQGDLIAFLDADDWWLPNKLALQAAAMQERTSHLISHTREIWYRRGRRVNQKKEHDPPGGYIFMRSLRRCVVAMSTMVARKELFERYGNFDASLPCCEDYDFWLRVAQKEPFLLVPAALACRDGGRPDQLSTIHRMGMDVYRIRSLISLLNAGQLSRRQNMAARSELAYKCTVYGRGCLKHGRSEEGEYYLNLAAQYHSAAF